MIFSFAGIEVDTARMELRAGGTPVHLEPQVFDVLCYLVENRDRLVTKQELLEQIWGDTFVSESALTSRIKTARRALGDSGREQKMIRTVHGRGYQFIAEVSERAPGAPLAPAATPEQQIAALPTGTVTFLFTDIERSTLLWERHHELMASVVPRHDELLRGGIESHGGIVFATAGDGMAAAFARVSDGVAAARQIRLSLDAETWPEPIMLKVRIGLHTGEALERAGDYLGPAVNRAARVMATANGGQTLLSDVTAEILTDRDGLIDLGICQIDPAVPPTRLWQLDGTTFAPLTGTIAAPPPLLRAPLIGRDADLERVAELTGQSRLVSITGPGGTGKTSLALAAANAVLASFPAGVAFAELAPATDAAGLCGAIATAAGIQGAVSADPDSIARHLAQRSMLLVLDNCEHLLEECAEFVDVLLDCGPAAHVLTTTREPLGIDGETVLLLPPLDEYAPELFVTRARAVAPDLDISADDPRVIDICSRLDGLPLAVELAAAQLRHLGMDQLHERLDHRLELSSKGRSRGGERHATLDRTIAWSYDLLDEPGQWLLRQLGVFPASFDLQTVEVVGRREGMPSALGLLSDLVAKSLVVHRADTGRFRLLETIRTFAHLRLEEAGEADDARERLRREVVSRATQKSRVDRWFSGGNAASFKANLDNARFAFTRSIAAGYERDALEILIDGTWMWRNTMNCTDGLRWVAQLRDTPARLDPLDEVWLALTRADLGQGTADHESMNRAAEEAIEAAEAAGDDTTLVIGLHFAALPHIVAAPRVAAQRLQAALEIAHSTSDRRLTQLLEAFAAVTSVAAGDVERGVAGAEAVAEAVEGDGYEVFIANWAAWLATLIAEDTERNRYWTDRQRDYIAGVGLVETWLTIWSMALSSAMQGEDIHEQLFRARLRADREGTESATDAVLALALVERVAARPSAAAELIGVVTGRALNNTAHYVLYRSLRRALRTQLGAEEYHACMNRGADVSPEAVLREHGLAISAP